jgi:hypothetical protein
LGEGILGEEMIWRRRAAIKHGGWKLKKKVKKEKEKKKTDGGRKTEEKRACVYIPRKSIWKSLNCEKFVRHSFSASENLANKWTLKVVTFCCPPPPPPPPVPEEAMLMELKHPLTS